MTRCPSHAGHSLGGALATLAAFDIAAALQSADSASKHEVICYTFGAPRTGELLHLCVRQLSCVRSSMVVREHYMLDCSTAKGRFLLSAGGTHACDTSRLAHMTVLA